MLKVSDKFDKIGSALIKTRLEIQNPTKSASGHRYKYADINSVLDSIISPCLNNGILVQQHIHTNTDQDYALTTTLFHPESNQYITSVMKITPEMNTTGKSTPIQEFGGSITYLKRYALMAIFCLSGEEDDNDGATSTASYSKTLSRSQVNEIAASLGNNDRYISYIASKFNVKSLSQIPYDSYDTVIEMVQFLMSKKDA